MISRRVAKTKWCDGMTVLRYVGIDKDLLTTEVHGVARSKTRSSIFGCSFSDKTVSLN